MTRFIAKHSIGEMEAYTQEELLLLCEKADYYIRARKGVMKPCRELVRDKTAEYYFGVLNASRGIMKPYPKDIHGDPRSPVNVAKLDGLFFGFASKNNKDSIYGEVRFSLPVTKLIDNDCRLYFTDFYCVPGKRQPRPHYVTLVITRAGSEADLFCQTHLLSLDMYDNPFFNILDYRANVAEVIRCSHLHVELYYTEDVHVREMAINGQAWLTGVKLRDGISGIRQPQRKQPRCPCCNLN